MKCSIQLFVFLLLTTALCSTSYSQGTNSCGDQTCYTGLKSQMKAKKQCKGKRKMTKCRLTFCGTMGYKCGAYIKGTTPIVTRNNFICWADKNKKKNIKRASTDCKLQKKAFKQKGQSVQCKPADCSTGGKSGKVCKCVQAARGSCPKKCKDPSKAKVNLKTCNKKKKTCSKNGKQCTRYVCKQAKKGKKKMRRSYYCVC